jgi:hypothetical protein
MRFPHSLGLLYSAFTYFCGFKVNSGEYKLMGLAPFGEPRYEGLILEKLMDLKEDGSFRLDLSYFNYCAGLTMTSRRFDALFGGPAAPPESPITQRECDLAASIQRSPRPSCSGWPRMLHRLTGSRRTSASRAESRSTASATGGSCASRPSRGSGSSRPRATRAARWAPRSLSGTSSWRTSALPEKPDGQRGLAPRALVPGRATESVCCGRRPSTGASPAGTVVRGGRPAHRRGQGGRLDAGADGIRPEGARQPAASSATPGTRRCRV